MEPEPEPMPDDVQYQDMLMDDIKEYRKILSGLLDNLNTSEIQECRDIRIDFDVSLLEDYPWAYSGVDIVCRDVEKHRNEITRIMGELEKLDDEGSKKIYKECSECYIYQYYYLGNTDADYG